MYLVRVQVLTHQDTQQGVVDALKLLYQAKAMIQAEADSQMRRIDNAVAALQDQLDRDFQSNTPDCENIKVKRALERERKNRYPVAVHPEVKVHFPDWVK